MTTPETKVSKVGIVEAAVQVLDTSGVEALSMRHLAATVGVGTMTLYHYFPDKATLLGAAIDTVVAPLATLGDEHEHEGRERVKAIALGVYDAFRAHPWLLHLRSERPLGRIASVLVAEHILAGLLDSGYPPGRAAIGNLAILDYISGTAGMPAMVENLEQLRAFEAALPPDAFPALLATNRAAIEQLGGDLTRRDMVAITLDVILDGLESST